MPFKWDNRKGAYRVEVWYIGADGKRKAARRFVKTRTGAKRAEAELRVRKERGELRAPKIAPEGKITVGQVLERYLRDVHTRLEVTSYDAYRSSLRRHVWPYLDEVRLQQLTAGAVSDWLLELERVGVGRRAQQTAHATLRSALTWALEHGYVNDNVARRVKPPARRKPEVQVISPGQERALLKAARAEGEWVEAYLALCLDGLRRGEAAGVRWCDVDLEGGRIHVRQALKEVRGEHHLGPPKSKRSRVVPLKPRAVAALRRHRAGLSPTPLPSSRALVFVTAAGGPLRFSNLTRREWARVKKAAGLPEGITLHSLRHAAAVRLLEAGASPATAAAILGHSRPSVTVDVYGNHVVDVALEAAVARAAALVER